MLEAPPGIEPGVEVLQTSALPLGDGAPRLAAYKQLRPGSLPAVLTQGLRLRQ